MKELLTVALLLLCLVSNGQSKPTAVLVGDSVHAAKATWNAFQKAWSDTEQQLSVCDSTNQIQASIITDRDSTITSMLRQKQASDTAAEQYRKLAMVIPKPVDGDKFWKPFTKGTLVGAGLTILGTAALKIIFSNKY